MIIIILFNNTKKIHKIKLKHMNKNTLLMMIKIKLIYVCVVRCVMHIGLDKCFITFKGGCFFLVKKRREKITKLIKFLEN